MFSGKPLEYQNEPLTNNGFWPDLNLKDFQEQRSLPVDIAAATMAQALLAAAVEVNAELENVEARWRVEGYAKAADVPGVTMAGLNGLCAQYIKAVFARGKADLMGEFATVGRRDSHPGQESPETRASLLTESSVVIRRMKGLKRATVKKV
ncbi:head completion/stabilization protein [Kluyvera intermedia]|uniref:head completion/stabilization protein n=1 Tax=Kluyvera intermedia TaxID=61648 RepID=UPI001F38962B|nr:head completion/stabilization protein [Kluyvera intermedia]MCE9890924.1 head completion/stabilization protein [Kluyvera intermedia]